jgi:Zn-finger nucleic acid-binding protein
MTFCSKCKVELDESEFDPRIGECPKCGECYTDYDYAQVLKSVNKSNGLIKLEKIK